MRQIGKPAFSWIAKLILAAIPVGLWIFSSCGSNSPSGSSVKNNNNDTISYELLKPLPPSGISIENLSMNRIRIVWNRVSDADDYALYRSIGDATGFDSIATLPDTSFLDSDLKSGTRYNYRLKAVNEYGSSVFSNVVSTTTEIAQPFILSASVLTHDSIRVNWGKIVGVQKYKLHRAFVAEASPLNSFPLISGLDSTAAQNIDGHNGYISVCETGDTIFADNIPSVKATYYYVVEAIDYNFNSKFSTSAVCTVRTGWVYAGQAGFSSAVAMNLCLQIHRGIPYVSFIDMDLSGKATVMKYNGAAWETVGNRGLSGDIVDYVSLFVYEGIPFAAYCDYGNFYRATLRGFDGMQWRNVGNPGFSASAVDYPMLFIEHNIPYVAYVDYMTTSSRRVTMMKYADTAWSTVGYPGFFLNKRNSLFSMQVVSETPYVAGVSYVGDSYKLYVWRFNGAQWEILGNTPASVGDASNPSMQIYESIPYVSFTDATRNNAINVVRFNGFTWESIGSPSFSGTSATFSSLYIENGKLYVAYVETNSVNPTYRIVVKRFSGTQWEYLGSPGFTRDILYASIPFPLVPTISLKVCDSVVYVAFTDKNEDYKATVVKFEP